MSAGKPVLKQGSRGPAVKELQMLLNAQLSPSPRLVMDGHFGSKTKDAVQRFQRQQNLSPDGVVGAQTWGALLAHGQIENLYKYTPGPQEPLADIAVPYIGATEASGNRMGTDPRMREIFTADRHAPNGATDGYPWCCAFVSMCVQKLIDASAYYSHVRKPYTPSVSNFRTNWAPGQNCLIFTPSDQNYSPHKGDILIFTFSHIGIVESAPTLGSVNTIEGNTNEAGSREGTIVRRKVRPYPSIRCFIRLPLLRSYDFENQMCLRDPAGWQNMSMPSLF